LATGRSLTGHVAIDFLYLVPTTDGIRSAAARSNLEKAWLWVRTNGDRTYKEYCRPLYRAYSLGASDRLAEIRDRLLERTYKPEHATKFYFPKPSGTLRLYSILSVDDQITYQALVNVVASKLPNRVTRRYFRTTFGNTLAGPSSRYFYADWRRAYRRFGQAMRNAFDRGYIYAASFDLTACYDSIDHTVLKHFLRKLHLDDEFSRLLCDLLSHWTDTSGGTRRIYHGHGIPQGPLPSGLLADVVLSFFDDFGTGSNVRYLRYVDDIRLFAKDEGTLRRQLIRLDNLSKQIGLFPQSSKIDIHRVTNIEAEFKSISHPIDSRSNLFNKKPVELIKHVKKLSPRFTVSDTTRFKYALGGALPDTALGLRAVEIVRREPSLYEPVFRYFRRFGRLSRRLSIAALDLLKAHDVYDSFAAALIRSVQDNIHESSRSRFVRYCRSRINGPRQSSDPELRGYAAAYLAREGELSWSQLKYNASWKRSWWVRAWVLRAASQQKLGDPSYEALLHQGCRDLSADPSLIAAELILTRALAAPKPIQEVHPACASVLKRAGRIRRLPTSPCEIQGAVSEVLGPRLKVIP
jgi:retron-type reverse transcriptase